MLGDVRDRKVNKNHYYSFEGLCCVNTPKHARRAEIRRKDVLSWLNPVSCRPASK